MTLLKTERLLINLITLEDAPFLCALMTDPDWIRNIGDRGIRTVEQAEDFIKTRFFKSYKENGFGFYSMVVKESLEKVGIVGLVNREGLEHIDIGYGILPEFRGQGFAYEATKALYGYAHDTLKLKKIIAIVNPDNTRSIKLLEKLGLSYEKMVRLPEGDKDIKLFS